MPDFLSILIFFPFLSGVLLLLFKEKQARWIALLSFLATFLFSVFLFLNPGTSPSGWQWGVNLPWIDTFGVHYKIGLDKISFSLVLLTTFLFPLVHLFSFSDSVHSPKKHFFLLMMLETALLGVFSSLDLFLFYLFWEAMLIPVYFLIGIWGGGRRIQAAFKIFIYTLTGSLLMLGGILFLFFQSGGNFDYEQWKNLTLPLHLQKWLFLAFFIPFAIKIPLFPFHSWAPISYREAPPSLSALLSGLLSKTGLYGLIRFAFPLFPEAAIFFQKTLIILCLVGIVYGGLLAWVQKDFKEWIAYSSVSHLALLTLGWVLNTSSSQNGTLFLLISHGLCVAALFLLLGGIEKRTGVRDFEKLGGMATFFPLASTCLVILSLAQLGLPGLSGFPGEFLVLSGAFSSARWIGVIAASTVILSAFYMLLGIQKIIWGAASTTSFSNKSDLSGRELAVLFCFIMMILLIGFFPQPIIHYFQGIH